MFGVFENYLSDKWNRLVYASEWFRVSECWNIPEVDIAGQTDLMHELSP